MLLVLTAWALLGPLFVGVGLWVSRGLKSSSDVLECFWLGVCATLAALNAWNLFFAIDGAAFAVFWLAGASGLIVERRRLAQRGSPLLAAAVLLAAVWVANRSLGPIRNWDTGIYHLPDTLLAAR